jgi:hypothetical protein
VSVAELVRELNASPALIYRQADKLAVLRIGGGSGSTRSEQEQ